ncbi:hypothetical protein IGI04_039469 [Brassica rapa subsp. trilocularis]|uniref:Uncharacterized protein n=1 Tax=Brassica rapa subsp. trilocularis TaxID=1813537 RepID=A0ABQ7KJY5_BRACM|nr:hypothetical protein IGI04_039469 [Brassica rapa subsp. trilocularis]
MGEGKKEGKYFAFTIYFGLFLIVALDVVAGFVAMEAEVAQQEVKTRAWSLECKSPSKKAFMLGLIALGCLLAAHFITVMIGCIISAINIADRIPGFEHRTSRLIHLASTAGAGILTMGIWMNRESRPECGFTNKHFLSLGGKAGTNFQRHYYRGAELEPLLRCRWSLCSASSFSTFALSFPFGSFPILFPLCMCFWWPLSIVLFRCGLEHGLRLLSWLQCCGRRV